MGGGASTAAKIFCSESVFKTSEDCDSQPFTTHDDDDEDEIDVEFVYTALFKMSFFFEIDESLKEKLVTVICHTPHYSERERLFAVQKWIKAKLSTSLKYQETINLIKYMELYEPKSLPGDMRGDTEDNKRDFRHLDCPFQCNVVVMTAEIQRQRLSKSVPLYSNTERIFLSNSVRAVP